MAGKYQCSEPKLQDLEIVYLEFKMIVSVQAIMFSLQNILRVYPLVQRSLLRGLPPANVPGNVLMPGIWSESKDNCKKEAKKHKSQSL